ncbi:hypothetical protein DICA2_D06722 [Diutina catenulata]
MFWLLVWIVAVLASQQPLAEDSLESWCETQSKRCVEGIFANIGASAGRSVKPGVVIASPSKVWPDYFYQWTRDSALVMKTVIDIGSDGSVDVEPIVSAYLDNQYHLQRLKTRSGGFSSGGLGEPKFMVNNTSFDEDWGRPQPDGPALRVITAGNWILNHTDNGTFVFSEIIKPDLEYVMTSWNQKGFDLWEEIEGFHFYTSMAQLKALDVGRALARMYGDLDLVPAIDKAYKELKEFIWKHYPHLGVLVETPELAEAGVRTGTDAGVILASLHTHSDHIGSVPFAPVSRHVLNSLGFLIADMAHEYQLNRWGQGVALGRYKEDIYDGYSTSEGNPWFLVTASAAEVIYRLVHHHTSGQVAVSIEEGDWLAQFVEDPSVSLEHGTRRFNHLMGLLVKHADSFLEVVRRHAGAEGSLSEQFNRYNGFMQGAQHLTWSYAAVWQALRWRKIAYDGIEVSAKL